MSDITKTATIKTVVDGSGVEVGLNKINEAAARTGRNLEKIGDGNGFAKVGADAGVASTKVESAQRNLIGSIQRTTAAMEAGGKTSAKYYEILAQQRGVDAGVLAPYLAQLRAVEAAQVKASASLGTAAPTLDRVGMSAKQTAAALRGVPAQFTDIFTSLQGGQAPLTVFLQQGGQLKDMFGGAGNAARAMGGYLLGLINPFTVAAAAAVGLAVAYNQGANEAQAYTRALIITGNAAGTTSGQLSDMARNISSSVGTQGAAAEALAAMAGTGRVAANNLQYFSEVAVKAQSVLGIGAANMAKEFAELGKAPLKASEQLTEKYRYLTAAVYEQIKAAEEQGRVDDAASIAQNAYARAMGDRAVKVKESLGTLETAWNNLASAAKKGWDLMLSVGREDTLTQKLAAVQAQIAKAQKPFDPAFGGNAEARAQLKANLELEASLQRQIKSEKEKAVGEAASIKRQEALQSWSREGEKFLSKEVLLQREITQARTEGAAAGKSQAEIEQRIADIRKARSQAGGGKGANDALRKEAALLAELSGLTSSFASDWDALSAAYAKGKINLDQLTDAQAKLLAKQPAMREQAEASARAEKQRAEFAAGYAKSLAMMTEGQQKAISAANAEADKNEELARTYGMTKGAIEALELARLEEQLAQRSSRGLTLDEIETLERLIDARRRSAAAMASVDTQEAAKKANKALTDEWEKTVEKYEDVFRTGFADMLNKGKDGWKSFTKSLVTTFKTSVADQIYKMFAQPFVVKMVGSLLGVTGGSALSNMAQAATGGGGGGDVASLVSSAQAAYSAISGGFAGVSATLGSGLASLGTTIGSTALQGFGMGLGSAGTSAAGQAYLAENVAGYSVGASAAPLVSAAAGIAAGVLGGRALSNGYAFGGGSGNSAVNVGTAIGAVIAGPIGAAIGGVLGGAANRLFGHKAKEITGTTLNGTFGEAGFVGTADAAWMQKGGVFRSDKSGIDKTSIDAATAKQFSAGYDALKAASADFANVLGLNADSIKNRSQSLSIALTKDEEANKKAIADFFIGVGDTIAKELLPNLSDFAKEGEGASATLQRLATNYATIDAALTALSMTFGAVGVESLAARERLVTLSGGIEALVQNAAGFAQNYLTEAERLAPVAAAVAKSMSDLGFSTVDTRDEFKALVQSLDLTTESGAANYAALMKLQGAFAEVAKASEVAADAAITNAKATAAAASEAAKASADGLLSGVDDAFSVMQRVASAEKDRLTKAHEVAMKRLQISIDTETSAIAKHRALSDALKSTISQIGGGPDRASAQAQVQTAIALAKAGGVLPSADSLKDALAVLSRDASGQFSTLQDFQRDQYRTQNSLAELGKLTDSALSVEERTLKALEDQKLAAEETYKRQIDGLDAMVSAAQTQIDVLRGIDTTGLTIVQALEAVRTAILAAQGNPVSGSTSAINDAYKSALGRAPDAAGLEFFQGQAAAGTSISSIVDAIKNSPEAQVQALYKKLLDRPADAGGLDFFLKSGASIDEIRAAIMQSDEYKKNLRGFAVGTNYLPATMPILAHEGERIIPAADNRALMQALRSPSDNNAALAAAVQRLTAEVEGLRAEARATAVHTAKTSKLLDRVIKNDKLSTVAEITNEKLSVEVV